MLSEHDESGVPHRVPGEALMVPPPCDPTDLLPRWLVCRKVGISRETLLRWVRNWKDALARGEHPADLLGRSQHFPPHTHADGHWKRWERRAVDAWCEARRMRTLVVG